MKESAQQRAVQFVTQEQQFHLGFLPTEQSSPLTKQLDSTFAAETAAGVRMLQSVDRNVLTMAQRIFASAPYRQLVTTLEETIRAGHRVIFSGCGATGRLAILLESLWRTSCVRHGLPQSVADCVESIMTGGDFALVKSVEFFEDYASFGRRQVEMARMTSSDTLVAITEGGETSSVLGTVSAAAEAGCAVFLLFNNPADLLAEHLERCRQAMALPQVTVLDLSCGPMALAGSTRMQATTSEQLVAGAALETVMQRLRHMPEIDYAQAFENLLLGLESDASVQTIARYIDFETDVYRRHGKVTYFADDGLLDIFTDTTERSPTFMLPPFRKRGDVARPAPWTFVKNPLLPTSEVWRRILQRPLRCLSWQPEDYVAMGAGDKIAIQPPAIAENDLLSFAIGREDLEERHDSVEDAAVLVLYAAQPELERAFAALSGAFGRQRILCLGVERAGADVVSCVEDAGSLELMRHLCLKLMLNTISTGVMTCLGRVSGNWMSWVDCTNKKLLDRGARLLVELAGVEYERAVVTLFEALDALGEIQGEKPSPVQVAREWLSRRPVETMGDFLAELNPSWSLNVQRGEKTLLLTPENMEEWQHDVLEDGLHLDVWTSQEELGEMFSVLVEWRLERPGRFVGRLRYAHCPPEWHVLEAEFPVVTLHFDVDGQLLGQDAATIRLGDDKRLEPSCQAHATVMRPHGQCLHLECQDETVAKAVHYRLEHARRLRLGFSHRHWLQDEAVCSLPYTCSVEMVDA